MKQMLKWCPGAFDGSPIGVGYGVEADEFDWKDENGICYDKDGATGCRLEWNGPGFVWTGDGQTDELTAKYAAGADVLVTECQTDLAELTAKKYGLPPWLYNYTIDTHHTPHYAVGYLMSAVNPRKSRPQRFPCPLARARTGKKTGVLY